MAAKMARERKLQDNESDLGSLPSIAFVKSGGAGEKDEIRDMIVRLKKNCIYNN